jgi:hypothetical protein
MRTAQIAPLAEGVPPVAWLFEELVNLGQEVTLFAIGDSRTRGPLHHVWPCALRIGRPRSDSMAALTALLDASCSTQLSTTSSMRML